MTNDLIIANILLMIIGTVAVFLVNLPIENKWRRWGCIVGAVGEFPWLYVAIKTGQFGIVVLCFVYGAGWISGIYNNWIRK